MLGVQDSRLWGLSVCRPGALLFPIIYIHFHVMLLLEKRRSFQMSSSDPCVSLFHCPSFQPSSPPWHMALTNTPTDLSFCFPMRYNQCKFQYGGYFCLSCSSLNTQHLKRVRHVEGFRTYLWLSKILVKVPAHWPPSTPASRASSCHTDRQTEAGRWGPQ